MLYSRSYQSSPIAIVGIACRFPGRADHHEKFWSNIRNKVDSISPIPDSRWNSKVWNSLATSPNTQFAKVGGFVEDIDKFDAQFFGISPREAPAIDPQQRMLLELSWQCMEDSAISPIILAQQNTGVYVGVINHDYERLTLSTHNEIDAYTGLGRSGSIAANRISYHFNFKGPSLTIDTACSSSLVAVASACQDLATKQIDAAFAGGANAILLPESYIEFSRASMLSASGQCHAFDAKADGFVRAEGGGMVLLKRLGDALTDGDRIYATIIATNVNQDGRTTGIMAPSVHSQKQMMLDSLSSCNLHPSQIGYVEAHGTGTQAGDAAEAQSLGEVYGKRGSVNGCTIGSVKTNIGHTESAAGIAGLIKASLAVYHAEIPPNLNYSKPNPEIDFASLGIRVPTELEKWNGSSSEPRIAAVNSFGFGGTNAHALLQQSPHHIARKSRKNKTHLLLPLSVPLPINVQDLDREISALNLIDGNKAAQLCHTAGRRPKLKYRYTVPLSLKKGVIKPHLPESLSKSFQKHSKQEPQITFVFSGIGVSSKSAGVQLYAEQPVFRDAIDLCDSIFAQAHNLPELRSCFQSLTEAELHNSVRYKHAKHFSLQIAISELWKSWGIQPAAVIGHSVGEISAAYVAGSVDILDATRVIVERARVLEKSTGKGLLLVTLISKKEATRLTSQYLGELYIAAFNSDSSITFAGTNQAIQEVSKEQSKRRKFWRILEIPIPFHCPLLDEYETETIARIEDFRTKQNKIRWFSSVLGSEVNGATVGKKFWWLNFRNPVYFTDALHTCCNEGFRSFVEIGPHSNLSFNIEEHLEKNQVKGNVFSSLKRNYDDNLSILSTAGKLFDLGLDINWTELNTERNLCNLPFSKQTRKSYWTVSKSSASPPNRSKARNWELLRTGNRVTDQSWEFSLLVEEWPWLGRHRILGEVIFPAAGYIEAALEVASEHFGEVPLALRTLVFPSRLRLSNDEGLSPSTVSFVTSSSANSDQVSFKFVESNVVDSKVFSGGTYEKNKSRQPTISLKVLQNCLSRTLNAEDVIERLKKLQIYGDTSTWKIKDIRVSEKSEALLKLKLSESINEKQNRYLLDPSLLDSCFRASVVLMKPDTVYVPVEVDSLEHWQTFAHEIWCHIHLRSTERESIVLDFVICDSGGRVLVNVTALRLKEVTFRKSSQIEQDYSATVLEPSWAIFKSEKEQLGVFKSGTEKYRTSLAEKARKLSAKFVRQSYYDQVEHKLTEITIAYIAQAIEFDTSKNPKNQSIRINELIDKCGIKKEQEQLFYSLIDILESELFIRVFTGTNTALSREHSTIQFLKVLPSNPVSVIYEFLQNPSSKEYLTELMLIDRCGQNLSAVLSGKKSGLDTLFPDSSINRLKDFYENSPTCRIFNILTRESIDKILSNWSFSRKCRILEVGGGTGALLSYLEPILKQHRVEYVFTDISRSFIHKAQSQWNHLDFIQFDLLDIDSDFSVQGFIDRQFDIVLASDVIHLAKSIPETLDRIRKVLVPGGLLHFTELTSEPSWARLVFGMLPGWSNNADSDRSLHSPFRPNSRWIELLRSRNFEMITQLGDRISEKESLHTVFIAQSLDVEQGKSVKLAPSPSNLNRLVFCDQSSFSSAFLKGLDRSSTTVVRRGICYLEDDQEFFIRSEVKEDYVLLMDSLDENDNFPDEIIVFGNFACQRENHPIESDKLFYSDLSLGVAKLIQTIDERATVLPRITFVTSNTVSISTEPIAANCVEATLWGIGRTIRNEYPNSDCRLIDIDESESTAKTDLLNYFYSKKVPNEIAIRNSEWHVPVLKQLDCDLYRPEKTNFMSLSTRRTGDLNSLQFTPVPIAKPGSTEVVIEVSSSSLNFRDVMVAMDALPDIAIEKGYAQNALGIECAGTIIQTGKDVRMFEVGDKVVALAKNSMASIAVTEEKFAFPIPEHLNDVQIVGLPTAYVTAFACLSRLKDINGSRSILIHTASGGVGLALISLLEELGTKIFATVGNNEKSDFLRLLRISHVSDSRSNEFVKDILRWTEGKGVDVIINTLGGSLARENKNILKPAGTYIELGKQENQEEILDEICTENPNSKIHIIDIDRMWKDNPSCLANQFRSAMEKITTSPNLVLPHTVFSSKNVKNAFRYMAAARHVGKVIMSMETNISLESDGREVQNFSSEGTIIVAGGTRGFGLATTLWLSENDAKNLVLISRSTKVTEAYAKKLQKNGSTVVTVSADITHLDSLTSALEPVLHKLPSVTGVFHCAMEIEDRILSNLGRKAYFKSTRAKILGAWNLYQITKASNLNFFALYSSVTSLLGPAGQAAYSSSNSFLDSFALFLRGRGIKATAINWGAVADFGFVARNPDRTIETIENFGITALPAVSMLDPLLSVLATEKSQVVIAGGKWAQQADRTGQIHKLGDTRESLTSVVETQTKMTNQVILNSCNVIRSCLSTVLQIPENEISQSEPLIELGIDSLLAVELSHLLKSSVGIEISAAALLEDTSMEDIIQLQKRLVH